MRDVPKRKMVPPHMLSPTQFLVHSDIVDEKIGAISAGEKPSITARQLHSGHMVVEDGHHTAAAYEALGQKVPVKYSTADRKDYGHDSDPDYSWDAIRHVDDDNPDVDHPDVGPIGWNS